MAYTDLEYISGHLGKEGGRRFPCSHPRRGRDVIPVLYTVCDGLRYFFLADVSALRCRSSRQHRQRAWLVVHSSEEYEGSEEGRVNMVRQARESRTGRTCALPRYALDDQGADSSSGVVLGLWCGVSGQVNGWTDERTGGRGSEGCDAGFL